MKLKKIPPVAWVALGLVVIVGFLWWERRKAAASELGRLQEESQTGSQTAPMFDWGAGPSGSNSGEGGGDTPGTTPEAVPPDPYPIVGYGYGPYYSGPEPYSAVMQSNFYRFGAGSITGTAATGSEGGSPQTVYTTPGQGPGMTPPPA